MPTAVADLVRVQTAQSYIPASQTQAKTPATRFVDVLSGERARQSKPDSEPADPAKAESRKPAETAKPKAKKSDKTDKAKPHDEDDDKKPEATDNGDDTAKSPDASHAQAADPTKANAKPDKPVKPDDDDARSDSTDTEADATAEHPDQPAVDPTKADPADHPTDDAEAAAKPVVKKKADAKTVYDTTDAQPDPQALAAAAQQTAAPKAPTPAKPDASTDPNATAAIAKTAAKPATTKADPATSTATTADGPKLAVKPQKGVKTTEATADAEADAATATATLPPDFKAVAPDDADATPDADALAALQADTAGKPHASPTSTLPPATPVASTAASEKTGAENNVDRIVTSVHGELLSKGGTMQIRLDPPSLGTVNIRIDVSQDGTLSASLQTDNEQATRMLSHNLSQLKTTLESAGVTVEHIQVKQAAPSDTNNQSQTGEGRQDGSSQQQAADNGSGRQEQQRREMLQRMWAKLAGTGDPLDLVA